jgi:hypothetical protein
MSRHILSILLITALISSCGNSSVTKDVSKADDSSGAVKVGFESLTEKPDNYINKNIIVEGKVVHVCTMSGKKMFIVGKNPDVMLFIAAGENMPKFPMELLGSEISVEGVLKKVAGPEMGSGSAHESHPGGMREAAGGGRKLSSDNCETETALASQTALADLMMEYKSHKVK